MATDSLKESKIFYSWQSDSQEKENRYFIGDCLKRAVKKVRKEKLISLEIDRDTKGVGGSPGITDIILSKLRIADIFVWDATIVSENPRPAPNSNVLFEHGYALSLIGSGRIIGVMNIANGFNGESLPFDFAYRRWPITYELLDENSFDDTKINYLKYRKNVRNHLVDALSRAIEMALKEEKIGVLQSDVDFEIVRRMWRILNSRRLKNWRDFRLVNIQHQWKSEIELFHFYIHEYQLPENEMVNENLKDKHNNFLSMLKNFLDAVSDEMQPAGDEAYVINTKAVKGWIDDYDKRYRREITILRDKIQLVWSAWIEYIKLVRSIYPEIVRSKDDLES